MQRATGSSFFRNCWYPLFSVYNDSTGKDDRPAVEAQREMVGPDLDVLTAFLENSEDWVSLNVKGVKNYCKDVNGRDVEAGVDKAGTLRNAWLDDMTSSSPLNGKGKGRVYENPLTPARLLGLLKRPRYNDGDRPNADRRLIYIADPTPEYVYALAATAPFHQVRALRDALCKYLAFQTSISVATYRTPSPVFKMEFHLPAFALRNTPPEGFPPRRNGADGKPLREWIDLSFLKPRKTKDELGYGVYEAQMSFALCGTDDWQWVAYSFIDADHDGYNSTDRATAERCAPADGDREDPISGLPAEFPIWNPRLYFLKVFEVRSKQVKNEWDDLVWHLEHDIRQYEGDDSFTWPQNHHQSAAGSTEKMKTAVNWAHRTMRLLRKLQDKLGNICREWNNFDKQGNIDAFFDFNELSCDPIENNHAIDARHYLQNIKETFYILETHQQTLMSLNDLLDRFSFTLQLRLSLEVNVNAEHNGFTTYFSLWVLYPITLATSIFSMQPTVIPFDLTPMWYCITVGILFGGMAIVYCLMMRLFLGFRESSATEDPKQETVHLLEKLRRFWVSGRPPGRVENQV